MFIIIPFVIFITASAAAGLVVFRKLSKNDAVTVEADGPHSLGRDFFPELYELAGNIQFHRYRETLILELEKVLRKIRIVFLAIERVADRSIHSLRRAHKQSVAMQKEKHQAALMPEVIESATQSIPIPDTEVKTQEETMADNEEKFLIDAIASDHKNPELYVQLGNFYFKRDNFNDAYESYKTALKLKPSDRMLGEKLAETLEKRSEKRDNI